MEGKLNSGVGKVETHAMACKASEEHEFSQSNKTMLELT